MTHSLSRAKPHIALLFSLLAAFSAFAISAHAVEPDEVLEDPALEARARELSLGLRCVVCQNQSIDDSNAPLAKDLRVLVRERLTAGDTNEEALDFIVARYGNFVLLKPPVQVNTLFLWFGPALLFLVALLGFAYFVRRRVPRMSPPGELTANEREQLDKIMKDGQIT